MKLEAVLQSLHLYTTDAIVVTDAGRPDRPEHLIVYANEAFEEQTGHRVEEIIGKSPSIFQGPNSDPHTIRRMSESLRLWKPVREEILNYRKDGTEFWVDLSIGPVSDESGWVHYWVSIQRDITEKKNTEKLLEQQKAQLDLQKEELKLANQRLKINEYRLIEAQRMAKVGSWYLDLKTNEVTWTKALYDIFGFDCSLPPPPFTEHERLFTSRSWNKLKNAVANTIESGKPYDLELQTVSADGGLGWMRVHGEVVFDEENGIEKVALQGTAQDITKQKSAENKNARACAVRPLDGCCQSYGFQQPRWTQHQCARASGRAKYTRAARLR
ncbi:PAS domain-containing protein [Roseicyclus marinus]|uniref:PAS domain-containing protein n=1 Tax=Roseicyclus marinus TaxID=2161673 RepID=UPI00240FF143|nr:PAS domain S-box protein [Roseicyclus marinus]MDG3039696.1 PAS domain S-box protein [Roseicyclus marinus]